MKFVNLQEKLKSYGADMNGINDRFMGDDELYGDCLSDFLEEPNFEKLDSAIKSGNRREAFDAAHAVKGLSGNLGLTPLYDAVFNLVEILRTENGTNPEKAYDEVASQLSRLKQIATGEPDPYYSARSDGINTEISSSEKDEKPEKAPENGRGDNIKIKKKMRRDYFVPMAVGAMVILLLSFVLLFSEIMLGYRSSIASESAEHLVEINKELNLYIEEKMDIDWKVAYSVSDSITEIVEKSNQEDNDAAVIELIKNKKEIWEVTDICIYTEDGYNIDSHGSVLSNDVASELCAKAREYGKYNTIINSTITMIVPVDTSVTYKGSEIAAVSVVQDLTSFLDKMNISSFDGEAYVYLTTNEGIVISKQTHKNAVDVFNIKSLIYDGNTTVTDVNGEECGEMSLFNTKYSQTVRIDNGSLIQYVVFSPVELYNDRMYLVYFVSEDILNSTMNKYSIRIAVISLAFIMVFCSVMVVIFLYVGKLRKQQYGKAIQSRERMFDRLTNGTLTAFGLFSGKDKKPLFISENAQKITGSSYIQIDKTKEGKYFVSNGTDHESEGIRIINQMLSEWDGKSEFRSGYIRHRTADPPRYYSISISPVDDGSDEYVGIAQDVTQIYERETATKDALNMAEIANKSKTLFLSNMSHDIRTPMNAIINMTDFATENINNPEKLSGYLKTIRESSDHLLMLINDILDMSRIESGKMTLDITPFELEPEMNKIIDMVKTLCISKKQLFLTDISDVKGITVLGDRLKVSQIVMNLLSNAVKFTHTNGAVRFSIKKVPSIRENIIVFKFIVEDNGIGIKKELQRIVFEPFARGDVSRVGLIQGTGLGLSICKSYVNAMDGVISFVSEEGEGSVFTVELPFEETNETPHEDNTDSIALYNAMPFIGKRCLLCEDNPTNRIIAKTILERLGFLVDIAVNGREGVKLFTQSSADYYDIIYMDIKMPEMDGYEATIAIRESGHIRAKTVPIIAMSANVFAEDIENARIVGMNSHIGKPIKISTLTGETKKFIK